MTTEKEALTQEGTETARQPYDKTMVATVTRMTNDNGDVDCDGDADGDDFFVFRLRVI